MRSVLLMVSLLVIALAGAASCNAQSLPPLPLRTDPNLAALIAVRGQFTSLIVDEQRPLTLRVWAADFSPDEQVDFDQLLSRSFSELELPEEAGWGLFAPSGNYLEIQVRVTDRRGRLGRVEFRNAETWRLVSSIWANSLRTEATGVFSVPADLREMVAEVLSDTGRVLARIAVDVGKFDEVVPLPISGVFEPYYLEPVYCAHFGKQPDDATGGAAGRPEEPPGATTYVSGNAGGSYTTVYCDFINDSQVVTEVLPPLAFWNLYRRATILNTVILGTFRLENPLAKAFLVRAVREAVTQDSSRPLSPVPVPPYSEGCVRWRVGFTGRVTAVLAIPYERKKRRGTLGDFHTAMYNLVSPQRGFLSEMVARAANKWLEDPRNQCASGVKPGEVIARGDIYLLEVEEMGKAVPRIQNVTQEWRVSVKARSPDGREVPVAGTVTVEPVQPLVQPAPPRGPSYYQMTVPPEGRVFRLGKGWRYRFLLDGMEQTQVDVPAEGDPPTVTLYMSGVPGSPR